MVVVSTGFDEISPLSMWSNAMQKYDLLRQLEITYNNADQLDEGTKQANIKEEAKCLAEAIHALRQLASSENKKALMRFHDHMQGKPTILPIGHSRTLVNTLDPHWWVYCLTDLFCGEIFKYQKGLL